MNGNRPMARVWAILAFLMLLVVAIHSVALIQVMRRLFQILDATLQQFQMDALRGD